MACFEFSLYTRLTGQTSVSVILPIFENFEDRLTGEEKFQTLWLLHGGGGDHTDYIRKTAVEQWAVDHKLAVVMPEAPMWVDNDPGRKYVTYVWKELPRLLRKWLPLSDKREDNFIAGLSAGSGCAAKCALNHPELYEAVALMSGGPAQYPLIVDEKAFQAWMDAHPDFKGSEDDYWGIIERSVNEGTRLPRFFTCCGTEDPFIYQAHKDFKAFAERIGFDCTIEEGPGGHDWRFWNEWLEKIIDWLPLQDRNFAKM